MRSGDATEILSCLSLVLPPEAVEIFFLLLVVVAGCGWLWPAVAVAGCGWLWLWLWMAALGRERGLGGGLMATYRLQAGMMEKRAPS